MLHRRVWLDSVEIPPPFCVSAHLSLIQLNFSIRSNSNNTQPLFSLPLLLLYCCTRAATVGDGADPFGFCGFFFCITFVTAHDDRPHTHECYTSRGRAMRWRERCACPINVLLKCLGTVLFSKTEFGPQLTHG